MRLRVVCGYAVGMLDKTVVEYLQRDDVKTWPSVEEVVRETGVSPAKVRRALGVLAHQASLWESRRRSAEQAEDD